MANYQALLCILPPYMLDQINANGTPAQRELARRTIDTTRALRNQRLTAKTVPEGAISAPVGIKQRNVYTANMSANLPGILVRQEGNPASGDNAVDEAYDGAGMTYDLFEQIYGRNSIDDRGMRLDATVHYLKGYDNGFWNGAQMVYGDGDEDLPPAERLFNRFTIAIDIIAHELTHGVTQYEANLIYQNQSGALNESISDVFGALVKQRKLGQEARDADWIIGRGLFTTNIKGEGIRSMKAPGTAYDDPVLGKDPQPAFMKDYVTTLDDNGGVHINSGIPNHAFYIAAYEMGGFAWEKAGQIWYATLCDKLTGSSTFQDAASLTVQAAANLYGSGSLEQKAVEKGWTEVGVSYEVNSKNSGCSTSLLRILGFRSA